MSTGGQLTTAPLDLAPVIGAMITAIIVMLMVAMIARTFTKK